MSSLEKVGQKKDFKDLALTAVQVGDKKICVARAGDTFYAFEDRCSHAQVLLSRGDLEQEEVVCPLHGARFSIATGQALTPPAVRPIQTYEVKIQGDDILVEL
ncbi:MAG: Biphenyl 2,3-dioxygenase, ferredoxin component [Elusimicrobia bacterium]|nr:Biphenyl 2,3-dioxygenase, ferredoxin component [Elusimicrobiota bacterium]